MYKWFINQSYEHDYIPYLIGRGTVADYSYTATDGADFTLSDLPQETVTVIMPLFYFEGYRVSVQTPTAIKHPKVYQLDGLVAFDVEEAGTVSVDFTGTHSMQIGLKITELFVCFSAVTAAVYYAWYRPRKKLKDKVNPVSYRR